MGLPYSKQINAAFDQVTPLVAAGFEVLRTTKNVSLLLAAIQVLTVILLTLILGALFALLITINPKLENERDELVTPVAKWFANLVLNLAQYHRTVKTVIGAVFIGVCVGSAWGLYYTSRDPTLVIDTGEVNDEEFADTDADTAKEDNGKS